MDTTHAGKQEYIPTADIWGQDSGERISASIGQQDTGEPLTIFFGTNDSGQPCAHGSLVAMTGAGKTALFHTIITRLTSSYDPSELALVLMDGKMGVGFNIYRDLPHATGISLKTDPAIARSLLDDLVDEITKRNALFKANGVDNFTDHRKIGSPGGKLPRILFIADEYQILFDNDQENQAAGALLRISEQARSAGIHMLLGSQHAAPANMLHRDLIFSNIHLRMTMKVPFTELGPLLDLGPQARKLIETTCTETGRIVLNDSAGDDTRNQAGKVDYVEPTERQKLVETLKTMAPGAQAAVVLDGDSVPVLTGSRTFSRLLTIDAWKEPGDLAHLVHENSREGGFGQAEWSLREHPLMLLAGRELSLHGQAAIQLRRQRNENLSIVGEHENQRMSILLSNLLTSCLQLPPNGIEFWIGDLSSRDTEPTQALGQFVAAAKKVGYPVSYAQNENGMKKIIRFAQSELTWRRIIGEKQREKLPTILLILVGPEKNSALRTVKDQYGNEEHSVLGKGIVTLLKSGPELGIHTFMNIGSMQSVETFMPLMSFQNDIRHKIALQMSENESIKYIDSLHASTLHGEYPRMITALLVDSQLQTRQVFTPFALTEPITNYSLLRDIEETFRILQTRPHAQARKSIFHALRQLLA